MREELLAAVERGVAAGISRERLLLDPGIGFGKLLEHNLALLAALDVFVSLDHPVVLGCSRKAFLGALSGADVHDREHGTTVTMVLAAQAGVDYVRVHNAGAACQVLAVLAAVSGAGGAGDSDSPSTIVGRPGSPRPTQHPSSLGVCFWRR